MLVMHRVRFVFFSQLFYRCTHRFRCGVVNDFGERYGFKSEPGDFHLLPHIVDATPCKPIRGLFLWG